MKNNRIWGFGVSENIKYDTFISNKKLKIIGKNRMKKVNENGYL